MPAFFSHVAHYVALWVGLMAESFFDLDLQKFEAEIDAEMNQYYQETLFFSKEIAQQLMQDILRGNPYWSGRSKASWVVSLNGPVSYVASDVAKKAGALSETEAEARSLATLASLASFQVGDTIHITQGNFYIALIEEGLHGSTPGFIAAAVNRYMGLGNFTVNY
jgi:hypothetical protein